MVNVVAGWAQVRQNAITLDQIQSALHNHGCPPIAEIEHVASGLEGLSVCKSPMDGTKKLRKMIS
jgi:hypothetical protein